MTSNPQMSCYGFHFGKVAGTPAAFAEKRCLSSNNSGYIKFVDANIAIRHPISLSKGSGNNELKEELIIC